MRRGKYSKRATHRIRLSDAEIHVISRALEFYDEHSKGEIYDQDNWKELTAALGNVKRRFYWINDGIEQGNLDPQGLPRSC